MNVSLKSAAAIATVVLLAGCTQLSAEDRATLDQVRSIANEARMEALKATAAADAAANSARYAEERSAAAADAAAKSAAEAVKSANDAAKAAAEARLASERAERMFSRSQRK